MSQTSIIAASIIIAYIVFIAVGSELPCYLEILGISTKGQCQSFVAAGGLTRVSGGVSFLPPSLQAGDVTINPPVITL